jgi:thiamine pyrophosphate-dependent acetolactate synthase large subunit-like protein
VDSRAVWNQIVVVVCNNRSYLSDKALLAHRKGSASQRGDYRTVDLTDPNVDYARCAEAMGVFGATVSRPDDLPAALDAAFSTDRPAVLDIALDPWQHDDAFYAALQRAVSQGSF